MPAPKVAVVCNRLFPRAYFKTLRKTMMKQAI